jgi:hypothetical protein
MAAVSKAAKAGANKPKKAIWPGRDGFLIRGIHAAQAIRNVAAKNVTN